MNTPESKKIVPLTRKVTIIILLSLILGLGAGTALLIARSIGTLESSVESNMRIQSEVISQAIQNFMMPGYAPLAVDYMHDIKNLNSDFDISLFRTDGVPAFSDNETIKAVNDYLGVNAFDKESERAQSGLMVDEMKTFEMVLRNPGAEQVFSTEKENNSYIRIFKPLINLPNRCSKCHGEATTVRGIIDIRQNLRESKSAQYGTALFFSGAYLGIAILLALLLSYFMRSNVISPLKAIGDVCSAVAGGDFEVRADYSKNDELGILGRQVNDMIQGLYERFELSKYVSSSTIQSIKTEQKSRTENLTFLFSDIRGFTSYSDTHSAEEVVDNLNKILDAQTKIIHEAGGDIDKYVGDEIVAIFEGPDAVQNAAIAALKIQELVEATTTENFDGLRLGIGIHMGEAIIGMVGSKDRADFTVIGDNVNLASRLCDAATPGQIVISQTVHKILKDDFVQEGPYRLKVRGKENYQRVHILKLRQQTEDNKSER